MNRLLRCALALGFVLAVLAEPADSAPNRGKLSAQVDAAIRQQMKKEQIPAIGLAVVRNGKLVKAQGYGLANIELGEKASAETMFEIGSITKQFTATAIMLLAEEGKLSLDDSITKYFPEAPPALKSVTIRHLLTHSSGIPDIDGDVDLNRAGNDIVDLRREYTEDELVRAYLSRPPVSEPGAKWNYCNIGYSLLGILIHRVSGKPWFDFLRERVFAPLGMSTTTTYSYTNIIPNRATGYDLISGAWKNTRRWQSESIYADAAGGLVMSALDMAKWESDRILKQSSLDAMWTPAPLDDGSAYPNGIGWFIANAKGHRIVFHTGGGPGARAAISRYLDDRLTIVVMTNLGVGSTDILKIVGKVAEIYLPDTKGANPVADW